MAGTVTFFGQWDGVGQISYAKRFSTAQFIQIWSWQNLGVNGVRADAISIST